LKKKLFNNNNIDPQYQFQPKIVLANEKDSNPKIIIESIDTNIFIQKDETNGLVTEIVKFQLTNGIYDTIVRKISLEGTVEKFTNFKLISSDLKLISANVITDCFENNNSAINSFLKHPYVCIVAKFDDIDATDYDVEVTIGYEYFAKHILKKRERPFSSTNYEENVLIWVYNNFNKESEIKKKKVDLSVRINNKIDFGKVSFYPEKLSEKKETNDGFEINWSSNSVRANDFENFVINIPLFNSQCKQLNEIKLKLNSTSLLQLGVACVTILIIIFLLIYLFLLNSNKEAKETLSEDNKNLSFNQHQNNHQSFTSND